MKFWAHLSSKNRLIEHEVRDGFLTSDEPISVVMRHYQDGKLARNKVDCHLIHWKVDEKEVQILKVPVFMSDFDVDRLD